MSQPKLKVIAYSDYICPFCYIGYHRMEQLKKEFNLDVEWRPFEIHPETPKEGALTDELSFPPGYLEMAFANVKRLADEEGLNLTFSEILPNSKLAHYISEFARNKGKFDEFHKKVLESYWLEGKDIGDNFLLLDIAESVGLNKKEIEKYLNTDEPFKAIQKSLQEVRKYGLNGVPSFIIEDQVIVGAQSYDVFKKVIYNILNEKEFFLK
ncbi:MAG: DsbA family oxidoreductase [Candidatus Lokiarchaeota archaeon]|nr:DsbA family oxidoreductase [Candidatus Lokiarchaeota archaeon]